MLLDARGVPAGLRTPAGVAHFRAAARAEFLAGDLSRQVADEAQQAGEAGRACLSSNNPDKGLSASLSAVVTKGRAEELRDSLGAFVVDPQASRLARLRRAVGFAARAHGVSEKGHRSDIPWMVTLTYAGDNRDWKPEHITKALDCFRLWCKRRGIACRYVWVAELQQRGVIHYHVCAWLPRWHRMPKWDVRTSSHRLSRRWWPHGMTNRVIARHAVPYLMKYLSKGSFGVHGAFPHGARIFGVGGLEPSLRRARAWLGLPAFVQARASINDRWTRAAGGGWLSPSGVHFASEFQRRFIGDAWALERVCDHGKPVDEDGVEFAPHGPFSWLPGASLVH